MARLQMTAHVVPLVLVCVKISYYKQHISLGNLSNCVCQVLIERLYFLLATYCSTVGPQYIGIKLVFRLNVGGTKFSENKLVRQWFQCYKPKWLGIALAASMRL